MYNSMRASGSQRSHWITKLKHRGTSNHCICAQCCSPANNTLVPINVPWWVHWPLVGPPCTKTIDLRDTAAPEAATSHLMQIFSAELPDDRPLSTWQQPSVHLCTKLVVPDQRFQQNSKPRPKQEPVITAHMHDAGAPQITSHHQVHLHQQCIRNVTMVMN